MHPSANPSAPQNKVWQHNLTDLTLKKKGRLNCFFNQKFQKFLLFYWSYTAVNKQYISQFKFLKLTKQIKFKFHFCLILHLKPF